MTHLAAVGRAHSASSEYLASLIGGDELTLHQRASNRALSKVDFSGVFKDLRVALYMVLAD